MLFLGCIITCLVCQMCEREKWSEYLEGLPFIPIASTWLPDSWHALRADRQYKDSQLIYRHPSCWSLRAMVLHRRRVALVLGLVILTVLLLWSADSYLRKASEWLSFGDSYDGSLLEIRQYRSDVGWFQVLFSRVRDAEQANAMLAANAKQTRLLLAEESFSETELDSQGDLQVAEETQEPTTVSTTMIFRPLTRTTAGDPGLEGEQWSQTADENPHPPVFDQTNLIRPYSKRKQILSAVASFQNMPPSLITNPPKEGVGDVRHVPVLRDQQYPLDNVQLAVPSVSVVQRPKFATENRVVWAQNKPSTIPEQFGYGENKYRNMRIPSVNIQQKQEQRKVVFTKPAESTYQLQNLSQFIVKSYMSWPLPLYTRTDILLSQWVKDLKQYLSGITTFKQISIVTANLEHREVVLNWIVSAIIVGKLPLENVLVLSLSRTLHELLISKKINSIYVPPSSVISASGLRRITSAFNQIHIVRLTFFRLINHWGYDVVMYDGDAIVLKDPQPLFDAHPGVELVGSAGKGPESIGRVWGRTICTGVLLMRSTPSLEIWWEQMSKISRIPFTDQGLVNIALKALKIRWDLSTVIRVQMDMHGVCNKSRVQAVILSEEKICRYRCESRKRDQYFVWHKPAIKRNRTVEKKKARAQEGAAWFLKDNWTNELMSSLTGFDWIQEISSQLYS